VPLAGREPAEVSQGVESLEKRLGDGGKLLVPTDIIQARHQPVTVAADVSTTRAVQDSARLKVNDVSEELFSVEIGERPDLVRIHLASAPKVHNCLEA
jgi:hypothetical protein